MVCKAEFRKRVRVEMVHRDLTVPQLATQIGRSREAIYAVLNDRRDLPLTKTLICKALGVEDQQ